MSFDLKLVNGNLTVDNNGALAVVRDSEKLKQDVLKIIITPLGGNIGHPWYGSNVGLTMIGNIFDKDFTLDTATAQLQNAIETLQIIQKTQAQTQSVTAAESIMVVKDVYINSNPTDPRILEVKVTVLSGALTPIETGFNVRQL